jgi:hypothetical protein
MRTHLDIKHEGTLGQEGRTNMTFDENSISHLMSVLTDLSSNTALAVIREYSTNARDAHVAAGCPERPIEVTLPNTFDNTLIIKDFGTGMSKDDITDHFSKYGWSSKRETDDETGTLGLGCKSGLTYTSQFTLVTVQDGIANTVLVTREEAGGGVVQVIDTEQTDEPNGTEVRIPSKNHTVMRETAMDFFFYWDRGTVLVDGEEPPCIWDEGQDQIKVDDDIMVTLHSYTKNAYGNVRRPSMIVMGGVAYPIDTIKVSSASRDGYSLVNNGDYYRFVARVPIGTVNFVPSREALNYNKRTLDTIMTAWEYVRGGALHRHVQRTIDAAPNHKEAFRIWENWQGRMRRGEKLYYRWTPFTSTLKIPDPNQTLAMDVKPAYQADRSWRAQEQTPLRDLYDAALHVVGFRGTAIAGSTKERIRIYCKRVGIKEGKVFVYPSIFGDPWLTNATCRRVRFDVIKAIELPPDPDKPARAGRERAKYRVLTGIDSLDYVDELPETVACWLPAGYTDVRRSDVVKFSGRNRVAVVLAADEKRFTRDHPQLPTWLDWVKARIASIPTSQLDWINFRYHLVHQRMSWGSDRQEVPRCFYNLDAKDVAKIADPVLKNLVTSYRGCEIALADFDGKMQAIHEITRFVDVPIPEVPKSNLMPQINEVAKFYEGLLNLSSSYDTEHVWVKAINAFYIVKQSLHTIPVL